MTYMITALIWLYVAGILASLVFVAEVFGTANRVRLVLFVMFWPIAVPGSFLAAVVS